MHTRNDVWDLKEEGKTTLQQGNEFINKYINTKRKKETMKETTKERNKETKKERGFTLFNYVAALRSRNELEAAYPDQIRPSS